MATKDQKKFIDRCISENEIVLELKKDTQEIRYLLHGHSELFEVVISELKGIRKVLEIITPKVTRHDDLLIDHGKRINKLETQFLP